MAKLQPELIHRLRELKGWSQSKLAQKAGIDPKTLSSVLNGKPYRDDTISRIADALDVTPAELLDGSPPSAANAANRQITIQVVFGLPAEMVETSDGLSNLLLQIANVINAVGTVSAPGCETGSIKLTLRMCEEDARSLVVAAFSGHLEKLAFISLTVLDEGFEMPLTLPNAIDSEIIKKKKAYIHKMMRKKPRKRTKEEEAFIEKMKESTRAEERLRETLRKLSEGEELDQDGKRKPKTTGNS